MQYQWDSQQAKRDQLWKLASMMAASLVSVGVPLGIVIAALRY